MTQDEIIRMAREVWGERAVLPFNELERFAALVAAHEREKLAWHEPFDMDDHPPHRLCECRKCMEYFTPLPDCDAFAASGKPIADQEPVFSSKCPKCNHKVISTHIGEVWWCPKCQHEWPFEKAAQQPVSQEYQDHLVNQSFDWAAMAAKHQFMEGYRIGLAEMREKCAKVVESGVLGHGECAAAIRAIKFEGDTGFRPVSEMIAEHKQDPKKAAAIEKAKMRKAKQEPVAIVNHEVGGSQKVTWLTLEGLADGAELYLHPVRTKDLTDEEIHKLVKQVRFDGMTDRTFQFARAVIAADREKNK